MDGENKKVALALKVATLYYRDGFNQQEIASELNISRATVSRLLQYGRDQGLVTIKIHNPLAPLHQLQGDLMAKYPSLKQAIIVPGKSNSLEEVGIAGAHYIEKIVKNDDIIGLGWGKTVYQVAIYITTKDVSGIKVVQMKGSMANTETRNYAFETVNTFASAFNTLPQYLPVPVIFDHAKTKELVANDTHIKYILKLGQQANIAVFTVGTVRDSALLFRLGYFTEREQKILQREAVGDIFSRFIDARGQIVNQDINERTIGIRLAALKKKKHSILVAANVAKAPAIHGALVAGYANTLVIDQESANNLLEFS
ncbi:sugar-binding transcriptional regulator [uncultured Limosilactobacillus sp.]|uniref:sugar-binding transcriptional regulator n=1 Tax=uncultured Limosilactobacillus sp. TaxID=2837629 RepID=UPI00259AB3E9|nr:sugar-binding transcriptional regulator [uncultured Limosilactobacillus sp.]